jgi:NAD(P)-dependent dehydrogenase (short-subunit alcohol dehydrogenase family)
MEDFAGKVVVVTGAASGIGRGIARRAAAEGAHLVLADVDEAGLAEIHRELAATGARVRSERTDVRRIESVQALAAAALDEFGGVHLVFNNAGVMLGGYAWERTDDDWRWVLDVNLFGVVNGLRTFMPILLAQHEPAHMVNTASVGGLMVGPFLAPYIVSKHAVVALTESVYHELRTLDTPVRISALCPGPIATGITGSERTRPADLGHTRASASDPELAFDQLLRAGIDGGMDPDEVGAIVFEALRANRFWIYTHPVYAETIQARTDSILSGADPRSAPELDRARPSNEPAGS